MVRQKNNPAKNKSSDSNKSQSVISKKNGNIQNFNQFKETNVSRLKDFVDVYELPEKYNTTSITLIARDPHWIYAYWEISPSSIKEIRKKVGSQLDRSSYILRMYDVTSIIFDGNNANSWFDIDVGRHANNWYVNLWCDNITYCSEIGIRTPQGRFYALARSNFVTTPRISSSGRSDLIWMDVKDNQKNQSFLAVEAQKNKDNKRPGINKDKSSKSTNKSKRKIFLTEDDIKAYYSDLCNPLKNTVTKGISGIEVDDKDINIKRKYKIDAKKDGIFLEEILFKGLSKGRFLQNILLGSSAELILAEGASERSDVKRKFFFEIGTELIVHGRTEPDAEVFLGNNKIELRNDGTFTLRFALPDGKIPLDFTAQSKDKLDKRSITTAVERIKTKYSP